MEITQQVAEMVVESSQHKSTITLHQAKLATEDLFDFILENSSICLAGGAQAYGIVELLDKIKVTTRHVQHDICSYARNP